MAEQDLKKFIQTIDRIDDLIAADLPSNTLRTNLVKADASPLGSNIEQINGTTQTGDDWTPYFAELSAIADALKTNDADELVTRIAGEDGVEIADGALDTTPGSTDVAIITVLAQALNDVGQDELVSRITDSAGTQIDPLARQDTSPVTGSTSSASTDVTLVLGDYRKDTDIFVDVSGSATLTVEVRTTGGTWRTFDEQQYDAATSQVEQYSSAFAEIRASVNQNLNTLEMSAKGV